MKISIKRKVKSILSAALVFAMIVCSLQIPVFAAGDPIYLPEDEIADEIISSGAFYVSVSNAEIDESANASYIFKVARGGSDLPEASLRLNMTDITARYGNDYKVKLFGGSAFSEGVKNARKSKSLLEEIVENSDSIEERNDTNTLVDGENLDEETANELYTEDVEKLGNYLGDAMSDTDAEASAEPAAADEAPEVSEESEAADDPNDGAAEAEAGGTEAAAVSLKAAKSMATGLESDKTPMDGGGSMAQFTDEMLSALSLEMDSAYLPLDFAEGESEKYIEIIPNDNLSGDGDRMFMAALFPISESAVISDRKGVTVTIKDDEEQEPAVISFGSSEYYPEDGYIKVTLERSGAINQMVALKVSTSDGTAAAGRDYSQVDTEAAFPYGVTRRTINIPIRSEYIGDDADFNITLSDPKGCVIGGNSTARGIIPAGSESYSFENETEYDADDVVTAAEDATDDSIFLADALDLSKPSYSHGIGVGYSCDSGSGTWNKDKTQYQITANAGGTQPPGYHEVKWDIGHHDIYSGIEFDWAFASKPSPALPNNNITFKFINSSDGSEDVQWNESKQRFDRQTNDFFSSIDFNQFYLKAKMSSVINPAVHLYISSAKPILRPFDITLEGPAPLQFLDGDGNYKNNTELKDVVDATNVSLSGANEHQSIIRFVQDGSDTITINTTGTYSCITGFNIVKSDSKASTKIDTKYTSGLGNKSASVKLTEDFVNQYKAYINYPDNGSHGKKGQFNIQPILGYINATVNVHADPLGIGTVTPSGNVKPNSDGSYTYHKGDTIRFSQTINDPDMYTSDRIQIVTSGNLNQGDNLREYDGDNYIQYTVDCDQIDVTPYYTRQDNQITVRVAKSDLGKFDTSTGIFTNPSVDTGDYVEFLAASGTVYKDYYEMTATPAQDGYVSVWRQTGTNTTQYAQNTFYFMAADNPQQNIIFLTCEKADNMRYVLTGSVTYSDQPLNGTFTGDAYLPASGTYIYIDPYNYGISDDNGNFSTTAMYGINGFSIVYKVIASNNTKYETTVLHNTRISEFGQDENVITAYETSAGDAIPVNASDMTAPHISSFVETDENGNQSNFYTVEISDDEFETFTITVNNDNAPYTDSDGNERIESVKEIDLLACDPTSKKVKATITGTIATPEPSVSPEPTATPDPNATAAPTPDPNRVNNSATIIKKSETVNNDGTTTTVWQLNHTFNKGHADFYKASDKLYVRLTTDRLMGNGKSIDADGNQKDNEAFMQTTYNPINTGYTFTEQNPQKPVTQNIDVNTYMNFETLPLIGTLNAFFNLEFISLSLTSLPDGGERLGVGYVPLSEKTDFPGSGMTQEEIEKGADLFKDIGELAGNKNSIGMAEWGLSPIFGLYVDFGIRGEDDGLVFTGGGFYLGISGDFRIVQYFLVGAVPIYLGIDGDMAVVGQGGFSKLKDSSVTINSIKDYDNSFDDNFKPEWVIQAYGDVFGYAGVGLCGILGVRGGISFGADYIYYPTVQDLYPSYHTDGLTLDVTLKIKVDVLLFSIPIPAVTIAEKNYGYFKDVEEARKEEEEIEKEKEEGTLGASDAAQAVMRPRAEGTSDWLPNGDLVQAASSFEEDGTSVLLENGYDRADPQLLNLGNGKVLLVFVADIPERNDENRTAIMYSIYENNTWSDPIMIHDDGTADFEPDICDAGDKVLISWTSRAEDAEYTSEKEYLKSLNVHAVTLDKNTLEIGEVEKLTNDDYFNSSPVGVYDDVSGDMMVFYMKSAPTDDFEQSVSPTVNEGEIMYMLYDAEQGKWLRDMYYDNEVPDNGVKQTLTDEWGGQRFLSSPISDFGMNDPVIIDFDAISCDGKGIYTYTVDEDNNMDTNADRELFVQTYDFETHKTYDPVRITNDNYCDSMPQFAKTGDRVALFWLENNSDIRYIRISELFDEGYAVDEDFISENGSEFGLVYCETNDPDVNPTFGSFEPFVDADGNIYIVWIQPEKNDAGENCQEIYTAALISDENGSSWSDSVRLTHSGEFNDEPALALDQNGNLMTVNNQYKIDDSSDDVAVKDVKLVSTQFETVGSLEPVDTVLSDEHPMAGETIDVALKVKNTGLKPASGYTLDIYEMVNGEVKDKLFSTESNEHITPSSSSSAEFKWTMPESFEGINDLSLYAELNETGTGQILEYQSDSIDIEPNYEITDYNLDQDSDGFKIDYTVTNSGNADSNPTDEVVVLFNDIYYTGKTSDPYLKEQIGELKPGETKSYSGRLTIPADDFENGFINAYIGVKDSEGNNIGQGEAFELPLEFPYSITVNGDENLSEITLKEGESLELNTEFSQSDYYEGAEVNYSVRDCSVAQVNDDTLKALREGETTLDVMIIPHGGYKGIKVTVTGDGISPTPTRRPSSGGGGFGGGTFGTTTDTAATPLPTEAQGPDASAQPIETPDASGAETSRFADVQPSDWFYDSVEYVAEKGIMNGTGDGIFEPYLNVTRGMYATVLGRMEGVSPEAADSGFADVAPDEYYAPYIAWAAQNGIVDGYGDGNFGPEDNITREQIAKMTANYITYKTGAAASGAELSFTDAANISDWAREPIALCVEQGILNGNDDGTFAPQNNATRAETAAVAERLDKLISGIR